MTNLVEANRFRAQQIAGVIVPRFGAYGLIGWNPFGWAGYKPDERLEGALEDADTLRYWRASDPKAQLHMGFLTMVDIKEEERSEPTIIQSNVEERFQDVIDFEKPVHYKETIRHKFSKTISEAESAKAAWEVAAKAALSIEYAGIKGSLEVTGKYGEELARSIAESSTTEDEVTKEVEFEGPIQFTYEAYRSLDRVQRTIRARCDFDFKLYFQYADPQGFAMEWQSFRGEFIPVVKRIAPESTWGYNPFMDRPVSDEDIAKLLVAPDSIIEFLTPYDRINRRHINVL